MELADKGYEVYGVCRHASDELRGITPYIIEGIDVRYDEVVERLRDHLKATELDIVINVAGILKRMDWESLSFSEMDEEFQVNTLGPLRVVKAIEKRIVPGGKIIMITSNMGSISDNTTGGYYGYRVSKAALNMASVCLAFDFQSRNISVGIVHPGYVRTDMTGHTGYIEPQESARGIIERIEGLTLETSGTFWHQNGQKLSW